MATGKLIFAVKATHFSKIQLQPEEEFNTEVAHKYLLTHRKVHHCMKTKSKLCIHPNGLKFVPSTMFSNVKTEFYPFEQIHRFFVFKIEPLVLILCVMVNQVRYVSITRFKTEAELNRVCDEIQKIKGSGVDSTTMVTPLPDNNHVKRTHSASSSSLSSKGKVVVEEGRIKQVHHRDTHAQQKTSTLVKPFVYPYNETECAKRNSNGACDEWDVSEMYLQYDPKTGPKVTQDGPIYMFTAHQRHAHYHSIITCESSSDSGSVSSSSSSSSASRPLPYYATGTGGRKLSRQWGAEGGPVVVQQAPQPQLLEYSVDGPHRNSVYEEMVVAKDRRAMQPATSRTSITTAPAYEPARIGDSRKISQSQPEVAFTYKA